MLIPFYAEKTHLRATARLVPKPDTNERNTKARPPWYSAKSEAYLKSCRHR